MSKFSALFDDEVTPLQGELDSDDFSAIMADVKPLKQDERVLLKAKDKTDRSHKRQAIEAEEQQHPFGLSISHCQFVPPLDPISFKQDGIQDGVYKNLRLGKYPLEGRINLTKMPLEQAREVFCQELEKAHKRGLRVVVIAHGLGLQNKPQPAVLKSFINQWLQQHPYVIAFHSALKVHGGMGACYVLLKKNPEQKQLNREKHQHRFHD